MDPVPLSQIQEVSVRLGERFPILTSLDEVQIPLSEQFLVDLGQGRQRRQFDPDLYEHLLLSLSEQYVHACPELVRVCHDPIPPKEQPARIATTATSRFP
jgi:hypothetical protein